MATILSDNVGDILLGSDEMTDQEALIVFALKTGQQAVEIYRQDGVTWGRALNKFFGQEEDNIG